MELGPSLSLIESRIDRTHWFEQRRDHFIRKLVADFFELFGRFHDFYSTYLQCVAADKGCTAMLSEQTSAVRSCLLEQLTDMVGTENSKGPLWLLKDLCHLVWPEAEQSKMVTGSLFDWLIGSLFHEAMKLKENIYLLSNYGPTALAMDDVSQEYSSHRTARPAPLSKILDIQGLIGRIAEDVVRQIEQVGFLFGQANFLLRMMMPDLGANMLVIRLLAENEEEVIQLWGESLEAVFSDMFYGEPAAGFCVAGRSYLGGQWYIQALEMYRRALAIDTGCDEAIVKVSQLKAITRENQMFFSKSS